MAFKIVKSEDGDRLQDSSGDVIYEWESGFTWPDEDAIDAIIDDAGIGEPQKSVLKTLFNGPKIERSNIDEDGP